MGWKIDYIEDKKIVSNEQSGVITWNEQKKIGQELFGLAKDKGAKLFLTDHRNLKNSLSILEIDDLPKMLKQTGAKSSHKIAVLYNKSHEKKYSFFQSAAYLASLNVKVFTDEQKALQWLQSDNE